MQNSSQETEISGTHREVVNEYLSLRWLYQKQIVIYRITGPLALQEVAQTWVDSVKRTIEAWDANGIYLAVHDATDAVFTLTPYLSACIRDIVMLRPDLRRKVAIVMPNEIAAQLLRSLLRASENEEPRYEVFTQREPAMRWLLSEYYKHLQA